jgi:SAM-dependent methyltransferase
MPISGGMASRRPESLIGVNIGSQTASLEPVWAERFGESFPGDPADFFAHEARYLFATRFTRERDVLDLACGTGYGSATLRHFGARTVVGVDISEEAIEEARRLYSRPGIEFLVGDALEPPVRGPFGALVSFETIEHVAEPEVVLDVLVGLLAPGGVLVCSSPNRKVMNPGASRAARPRNPHHKVELTRREFRAALRERFEEVQLYGQQYRLPGSRLPGQIVQRAAALYQRATAWPTRIPGTPAYIVAVCRGPKG